MRILVLADVESKYLWDYFEKEKLDGSEFQQVMDGSLLPGGTAAVGELGASASRSAADLPFGEEGGVPQPEVPRSIGPEGPSDGGK